VTEVRPSSQQASGESSPDAVPLAAGGGHAVGSGPGRAIEAHEGESLMVALKRAGLGILAVCGGKGACGTCRVVFAPEWSGIWQNRTSANLRLLTHLKARPDERLSCRILLTAALSGLEVDACE
jgi:2Fe-2S ferredoxin